jgi:hypothetical protein
VNVGVVFSQADSGTDPDGIRAWARAAEDAGFAHLMAYDNLLGASAELFPNGTGPFPSIPYTEDHTFHEVLLLFSHPRLRQVAEEEGRDPATLPIHGQVYLGEGYEAQVEEALELGFSDLSIGFNRLLMPGRGHAEHLEVVLAAKPTVDKIVGGG